jgi:prepilin peptidase CpaA
MDLRAWLVIAVGAAAVMEDLRSRNISNWTSGGAVVAGLAVHGWYNGLPGLRSAATGAVVGFVVFLIFYLLGGMGGGDVKLMAGFGSLLGSDLIVHASFLTALCGGLMAGGALAVRALRRRFRGSTSAESVAESAGEIPPHPGPGLPDSGGAGVVAQVTQKCSDSIPYAPAITAGAWLALWMGS